MIDTAKIYIPTGFPTLRTRQRKVNEEASRELGTACFPLVPEGDQNEINIKIDITIFFSLSRSILSNERSREGTIVIGDEGVPVAEVLALSELARLELRLELH